jgi:plasmid stabilization system protein ParE
VKVRFTPRAQRRAKLIATWWRANRSGSPSLFAEEMESATQKLAAHPDLGLAYATVGGQAVRRLLLPKTAQNIYYSVDEGADVVIIQTLWGARRGRGPTL